MALTFPRDMTGLCGWRAPRLMLRHRQELSRSADGRVQAKDLGPAIWTGEYRSVPLRLHAADAVMAEFQSLRGAVHPFFLFDPTRRWPASLTSAAPLASSTVTVAAIAAGNDGLTLTGLPAGLVIASGDRLSVATAGGGLAYFKVVLGGAANGAGVSPALELTPSVRPGIAVGAAVTLVEPKLRMRLEPDTLDDPFVSASHREIAFRAVEDPL